MPTPDTRKQIADHKQRLTYQLTNAQSSLDRKRTEIMTRLDFQFSLQNHPPPQMQQHCFHCFLSHSIINRQTNVLLFLVGVETAIHADD